MRDRGFNSLQVFQIREKYMKMHKIELYVVDFEDYGIDNFITEIEQLDISACVHCKNERTVDIGDWDDNHIANRQDVTHEQLEMFFNNAT